MVARAKNSIDLNNFGIPPPIKHIRVLEQTRFIYFRTYTLRNSFPLPQCEGLDLPMVTQELIRGCFPAMRRYSSARFRPRRILLTRVRANYLLPKFRREHSAIVFLFPFLRGLVAHIFKIEISPSVSLRGYSMIFYATFDSSKLECPKNVTENRVLDAVGIARLRFFTYEYMILQIHASMVGRC